MEVAAREGQSLLKIFRSFHTHHDPPTELPSLHTGHCVSAHLHAPAPHINTCLPCPGPARVCRVDPNCYDSQFLPGLGFQAEAHVLGIGMAHRGHKWGQRPAEAGSLGCGPALMPSSCRTLAGPPTLQAYKKVGTRGAQRLKGQMLPSSAPQQTAPPRYRTGGPQPLGQSAPSESWRAVAAARQSARGGKVPRTSIG